MSMMGLSFYRRAWEYTVSITDTTGEDGAFFFSRILSATEGKEDFY
jgi:hypothetical protein